MQLPIDGQRSATVGYHPAFLNVSTASQFNRWPQTAAGRETLLAGLLAFLHRYSQQGKVAVDVHLGAQRSDGANTLLVRRTVDPHEQAAETIADVAKQLKLLEARTQASSVSAVAPGGSGQPLPAASRVAVANVAITFVEGSAAVSPQVDRHGPPQLEERGYDLHLICGASAAAGEMLVAYNARLFHQATIERMVDSYLKIVTDVVADPTTPLHRLAVLGDSARHSIAVEWDSGEAEYPLEPVHRLLEKRARLDGGRTAAGFKDQRLTYRQLDQRSSQLAHHLVTRGVRPGLPVAVCMQPSLDVLVGMLAVFKTGGIYLPLDPTHPQALLATILEEAQPCLVLTQSKLSGLTQPELFPQVHLDTDWSRVELLSGAAPLVDTTLQDPAYQLYTSGTTGKPKGVVATHGNLAHYIHVAQQRYGFNADDAFCSLARYTFSISMFELLSPLCCGGSVRLLERDDVLAPERLARTLAEMTVVHAGPSLMGNLFRYLRTNPSAPRAFPGMRHASSGGDLVPPHLMEEMKVVFPNAELFVIYGCTEISCMGTTYPVPRSQQVDRSFVGKAFPDVAVRLVDPDLQLVPFGVVGEICFAGKGVVPGYVNRPELTAEKFVPLDERRFYRTGDMGRLHPDGNIEILGRRDFQVQVRGIRIELAGIENTIRELGLAFQCAVLVKKLDDFDVRLVAFVVSPRDHEATIASFRRVLAERLPDYMLPQSLVVLEALPLTANGKLDRRRLDELPWQTAPLPATAATTRTLPRDGVERSIAAAFSSSLGIAEGDVGIDDNFFDLGGHSLLAVMLLEQLENKLGVTFPPDVLFEHATVRALGAYSQGSFTKDPRPILLNGNQDGPTLFVLVGVHLYRELAKRLEASYSVRAVYAGRELVMFDSPHHAPSVDELARDYVDIIRRHQPTGPYRLVGMSFGGIVAYEVARQLRRAGQTVSFLGLLDAVLPERGLRRRVAQVRRLQSLPLTDWGRLASIRLQRAVTTVLQAKSPRGEFAEFQKYAGEARLLPLEDQRQEAYRLATEDYVDRMTPFTGNVTLVVAGERMKRVLMQSSCLGWSAVVPTIRIKNVDADHLRLLESPHVDEVAAIFLEDLRTSEPASEPPAPSSVGTLPAGPNPTQ